jgi:hypothetical protein
MMFTPQEADKLARPIATELKNRDENAQRIEGEQMSGGVSFVFGIREDLCKSSYEFVSGKDPADTVLQNVREQLGKGAIPVGFVLWESKRVEENVETEFSSELFELFPPILPWARLVLDDAVAQLHEGVLRILSQSNGEPN